MAFPIKTCVVCSEEFELRPGKPGFANRCPACSEPESAESAAQDPLPPNPAMPNANRTKPAAHHPRDALPQGKLGFTAIRPLAQSESLPKYLLQRISPSRIQYL